MGNIMTTCIFIEFVSINNNLFFGKLNELLIFIERMYSKMIIQ